MLNRLKLRASFGYTGSQGFSSYNAITTFRYYNNDSYNGYIGSYAYALSNPDLRWQETYDTNFGLDFELFGSRLTGRVDYYISDTKGMITDVTVPATTGFSTYVANLGETENKGVEAYLNYRVYENLQKGNYINVYVNAAHNKNTLKSISNSLRAWNDEQDANMMEEGITTPSVKYYEGCSMTAIWAVKSLGIDPQTGQEIFVKKDGTITYEYDTADQVVCGDTQPKVNGNVGFNGEINGIGFSATCGFRLAAKSTTPRWWTRWRMQPWNTMLTAACSPTVGKKPATCRSTKLSRTRRPPTRHRASWRTTTPSLSPH